MPLYVMHRRSDQSVEEIYCDTADKARRLYRELFEVAGEVAWVEDQERRTLSDWELANA